MLEDSTYTEVFAWGSDEEGQLGLGDNRSKRYYTFPRFCSFNIILLEVSCGKDHSAMIAQNGYIYTMGSNSFGKLGINAKIRNSVSPSLVESLVKMKALKISCGFNHTAVAMSEGDVYTWGDNTNGQLGLHDIHQTVLPRKVEFKKDNFIDVSCGNFHTMCLNNSGSVFSFGMGEQGQLGTGTNQEKEYQPQQVKLNMKIIQIAAANFYTLFLTHEGKLMGCGDNSGGQLGIQITKQTQNIYQPQKAMLSGIDKFQFIKIAARSYSAALSSNNELIIFGSLDSDETQNPRQIQLEGLTKIVQFSLGNGYGIAVDQSGHICSWGMNTQGQLATNSTSPRNQPNLIQALEGKRVHKVAAGENHVIAFGTNQGLSGSRSQSRLSSERRQEQQSGKISRQQSAAQLQSLLNNRESGKFKSHTETLPIKRSFKSKQSTTTAEIQNDKSETYQSRTNDWQQTQMYVSNQRSITPTQGQALKMAAGAQSRSPLSNYTQDFTKQTLMRDKSLNSMVGSNVNLLQRQKEESQFDIDAHNKRAYQPPITRKGEDRCMSDYVQIKNQQKQNVQSPDHYNQSDQYQRVIEVYQLITSKQDQNKVIKDLRTNLQEKENHIVVVQSESHDNKLKLTRKIRQIEDELDSKRKQIDKFNEMQKYLQNYNRELEMKDQAEEINALRAEANELRLENSKLREANQKHANSIQTNTTSSIKTRTQKEIKQRSNMEDSGSFIISQITEQTPQQNHSRKQMTQENNDHLSKLKISPIQNEPIKTLTNYELENQNDDIQSYVKKVRPGSQNFRQSSRQGNQESSQKQQHHLQINKHEHNYATTDVQILTPHTVNELTPQRIKKESLHGTPPLPQKIEKKQFQEAPKPTASQDFSKSNWWSSEKRDFSRAQTGLKVREQNAGNQNQETSLGGSYKQNLNTIKTRLSDLQRNKSALENRMKLFEERLKERKQQEN